MKNTFQIPLSCIQYISNQNNLQNFYFSFFILCIVKSYNQLSYIIPIDLIIEIIYKITFQKYIQGIFILLLQAIKKMMYNSMSGEQNSRRVKSRALIKSVRDLYVKSKSREEIIRENGFTFPESRENKIVFITNQYGNGFQMENLPQFSCPSHIAVERMLSSINRQCYRQWKRHYCEKQKKPLNNIEKAIHIAFFILLLTVLSELTFVERNQFDYFYAFLSVAGLILAKILVLSFLGFSSCRGKSEPQDNVVAVIHRKLQQMNEEEEKDSEKSPRFRWSGHENAMWIAISIC